MKILSPRLLWVILFVTVAGFELNYPLHLLISGRYGGLGLAPEFFTSMIIAGTGLLMLPLFMREQKMIGSIFAFFTGWIILSSFFSPPDSQRLLLQPISLMLIMAGGYAIFRYSWKTIDSLLPSIIIIIVLILVLILFGQAATGKIHENIYNVIGYHIYQLSFGDLLSTELPSIFGIQLVLLVYLYKKGSQKVVVSILISLDLLIIMLSGSVGAVFGLVIIGFLYWEDISMKKKIFYAILILIIIIPFYDWFRETLLQPFYASFSYKLEGMETGQAMRAKIYEDLWYYALEEPWFGIGLGEYLKQSYTMLVPHHNLLGRACETGFPSAIAYLLFILVSLYILQSHLSFVKKSKKQDRMILDSYHFIQACMLIFVYLQFRGLATDTYSIKEQYFFIGAALGVSEWVKEKLKNMSMLDLDAGGEYSLLFKNQVLMGTDK